MAVPFGGQAVGLRPRQVAARARGTRISNDVDPIAADKSSVGRRPLIAIPARSPNATALRYAAEVTARALVEAVFAAGRAGGRAPVRAGPRDRR